eukprot:6188351-Pleurochrysis_carterae.AAC.4
MRDDETRRELLLRSTAPTSEKPILGEAQTPRLFEKFRNYLFVTHTQWQREFRCIFLILQW